MFCQISQLHVLDFTRLLQLKGAVEAVSIAVNLTTLSSPVVLRDLTSLLLKCLSAACIATSSFSSMSSSTKRSPSAQKGQHLV